MDKEYWNTFEILRKILSERQQQTEIVGVEMEEIGEQQFRKKN